MQFKLKKRNAYVKTMVSLSILTSLAVIGCILLGYLFLPFASALYASILIYEKKDKRIISFILPIFFLVINIFINGLYSLECIAYALIGILIFASVKLSLSKGETVFWCTLLTLVLFFLSLLFLSFEGMNATNLGAFREYYSKLYETFKNLLSEFLTSLTTLDDEGLLVFAYNFMEAEKFLEELMMLLIPASILLAFLSTGVSLKLFSAIIAKKSGDECGIHLWKFKTSNFIAYFYVIIAVISLFAINDGSIFTYTVTSINTILAAIYAYMGAYVIYIFILSRGKSSFFAISVIVIACIILSSFSILLLSLFGVYFNITSNKLAKQK